MPKNFFNIQLKNPFSKCVLYADVEEHLGTVDFFRENGIQIKRIKGEFAKEDTDYVLVCAVWKGEYEDLEKAIDKLDNKILLLGHPDFLNFRDELFDKFDTAFTTGKFPEITE